MKIGYILVFFGTSFIALGIWLTDKVANASYNISPNFIYMCFILGILCFIAFCFTPEFRKIREIEKDKMESQKAEENRKKIAAQNEERRMENKAGQAKKEFEKLSADPINVDALESVLNILNELDDKRLWSIFEEVMIPLLRLKPLESKVRKTIFSCSQKITTNKSILLTHQEVSQRSKIIGACSLALYEAALEILEEHPDQIPLKSYALDVGRWRYSLNRSDGKVTVYDEQAIQNDIQVRSR